MIAYEFILEPSAEQTRQIVELYQAEGWWDIEDTDTATVRKIIEGSHCFVAAFDMNRIIGMGRAISDRVSDAYIQDVTVAPAYRKLGIGSEIIKKIVSRLHGDGVFWIGLIAEKNSQPFYRLLDFEPMTNAAPMLRKKS